ncbi:MAG: hypothetical protein U9O94_08850 [Nanoarchaeota archaeon]|nr:hypothetical protein [Nanoarchaeota archaeon]
MKKIIILGILFFVLSSLAVSAEYIQFLLVNDNEVVTNLDTKIVDYSTTNLGIGDYSYRVYDSSDNLIETVKFDFSGTKVSLEMPYQNNFHRITILDARNRIIYKEDISRFSNKCGNNKCDLNENYLTCSQDCKSGSSDGICDALEDGICDQDCINSDSDCGTGELRSHPELEEIQSAKKQGILIWILGFVILLIIILTIISAKYKPKKRR